MEKVAHLINSLSDLIVADETGQITPITPVALCAANPGIWWIEPDRNGEPWLCRYAVPGVMTLVDVTNSQGQLPYTSKAQSFVGGHPISGRPPSK